ncbi:isoprenoid biosynthesis glyoxalase ElbB [Enterobacter bugandensis]|uniref:isoprenoid biosynthesis glyoxalase ElbB n=1 Tax=Enterobacter bugandensis TaxID=881260 RepID=UPI002005927A|nr:isoprenoid biosynthesis glyoxalase ElbB [Enterobacter bugandensis]MCK7067193.1 isoprenoid biosynthesis glyoxalase ElbB [Enterobacter bugandensis]HCM9649073.1 isoprenoid biosynthesis glyoxalase ElbB [Enterobacter bugandensis]
MDKKTVAVVLSGCGVYDGAEINEVVLTLLALENNGCEYQCFAPDIDQYHVIDHTTGNITTGSRNVLKEAARIVRGNIKPVTECSADLYSAVIIPGGFGVAKNLSTFALDGDSLDVNPDTYKVLQQFARSNKPAGYMCIAPVLIPVIYGRNVRVTIGNDKETIEYIERSGCVHQLAGFDEIVVDEERKVVTTPAYMLATKISEAKTGIDKLVSEVIRLS